MLFVLMWIKHNKNSHFPGATYVILDHCPPKTVFIVALPQRIKSSLCAGNFRFFLFVNILDPICALFHLCYKFSVFPACKYSTQLHRTNLIQQCKLLAYYSRTKKRKKTDLIQSSARKMMLFVWWSKYFKVVSANLNFIALDNQSNAPQMDDREPMDRPTGKMWVHLRQICIENICRDKSYDIPLA